MFRTFEGGVSESRTAATWDAHKRVALRDSGPCDEVSAGDFSGVENAAVLPSGGLAYSCGGGLRISDRNGDRELEPGGAKVTRLAVSRNDRNVGPRQYRTADATLRSLDL